MLHLVAGVRPCGFQIPSRSVPCLAQHDQAGLDHLDELLDAGIFLRNMARCLRPFTSPAQAWLWKTPTETIPPVSTQARVRRDSIRSFSLGLEESFCRFRRGPSCSSPRLEFVARTPSCPQLRFKHLGNGHVSAAGIASRLHDHV